MLAGARCLRPGSAATFSFAAGTYAEALAVPEEHLVRKPKNIKIAEAAGAPLVSLTAADRPLLRPMWLQ